MEANPPSIEIKVENVAHITNEFKTEIRLQLGSPDECNPISKLLRKIIQTLTQVRVISAIVLAIKLCKWQLFNP